MKRILLSIVSFLGIVLVISLAGFNEPGTTVPEITKRTPVFCAPSFDPAKIKEEGAPLFEGLGTLHYTVSTKSAKAQQYFDQGLRLLYGFNHGEAGRSFNEVIRQDPACAMAYWGLGMVLGPNYNAGLDQGLLEEINTAMKNGLKYAANATPQEQALVKALAKRFPEKPVTDITPYNAAYAAAMKQAHEQFPADVEIATCYADALMNEHPWDLYTKDGVSKPWTPAIRKVLEEILAKHPDHPGANHLYLHAMEASREAAKAIPSADRLRDMMPAAGHLVHMPSHVYIRTGNYHKAVIANIKSSAADSTYIAQCKVQGAYPLLLYPHNIHFLAVSAFMEGNSKQAIAASWGVSRNADRKYLAENPTVQHYFSIPYYTLAYLAKWDTILSLPQPGESLQYPNAIWHFARGMAFAGKGDLAGAEKELNILAKYAADKSLEPKLIWDMNSVQDLVHIAYYSLQGEIDMYNNRYDKAIEWYKKAVEIEDNLVYQEPPDWFFSVRHSLGYALQKAKRYKEAEKIFLEDLDKFPENGWALMGLFNSLKNQGNTAAAANAKKRFDEAWKWADITITSSRVF